MSQVLHIFQKDLRHLWPQIGIVLALTATACWSERQFTGLYRGRDIGQLISLLLPLAIWHLTASLVHNESLADDRHYWITRPIGWRRLIVAKALFVFVAVSVPIFIADCLILTAQGFSPADYLPGMIWRQAMVLLAWILPAAALGGVTKNLAQLALTAFVLVGLFVVADPLFRWADGQYWGPFQWIRSTASGVVAFGGAGFVVFFMYMRRGTSLARVVAASALLVAALLNAFLPWEGAFAFQGLLARQHAEDNLFRISFASDEPPPSRSDAFGAGLLSVLNIPLRIDRLPDGNEVVAERIRIAIETSDGHSRLLHAGIVGRTYLREGVHWHSAAIEKPFSEREKQQISSARVSLFLTLYGDPRSTRASATENPSALPGGALCAPDSILTPGFLFLLCRSPLRGPTRTIARLHHRPTGETRESEFRGWRSHSPFPASISASPITRTSARFMLDEEVMPSRDPQRGVWRVSPDECDVEYQTWQPLAHFRRTCEIPAIKLADYIE